MANLTSILTHCPRGREVFVGDESDIYNYEAGGACALGGVIFHPIATQADGCLTIQDLGAAMRDPHDYQCAPAGLICLENPHNRLGGRILPLAYLHEVYNFARARDLPLHLDGARIFNAAVALNVPPAQIAACADSVQFCLSKGLAAPIGSMVVGPAPFIDGVRRMRKMLGGGMRQVGVIAAAGVVALTTMVDRLAEDHARARRLATYLAALAGIHCDVEAVQTNMVFFSVTDPRYTCDSFLAALRQHGVRMGELGHGRIRAALHYGIRDADLEQVMQACKAVLA
jgi:threonine aldolase